MLVSSIPSVLLAGATTVSFIVALCYFNPRERSRDARSRKHELAIAAAWTVASVAFLGSFILYGLR